MEANLQSSLQFEYAIDNDDSKFLSRLSTILVANIQEVKDRISHIEFIFCNKLFPNFQSTSRLLEKRLLEARRTAEDEWKKKESILLHQIEELHLEKQHAREQIQQLNVSVEQSNTGLMNTKQLLNECESEKKMLLEKLESLAKNEDIIAEFKEQMKQKMFELAKGKEIQENLSQQIELKDNELLVERSKRRSLFEECKTKYKELKSQYNFLLKKTGCSVDDEPQSDRKEMEQASPALFLHKRSVQDQDAIQSSKTSNEIGFHEKLQGDRGVGIISSSNANSHANLSSSSTSHPPKPSVGDVKSDSSGSLKRAASSWRETRVRQQMKGADPHDDFLATPMEVARKLNMVHHEEAQDFPVPAPKDMDFNNSDDETQEIINTETIPQQQRISIQRPVNKGFKYVEPVRKKVERENLKGVECKQCKKFYDVVLPDGGGAGSDRDTMRCEHHDGVSRHRYRYAPPMTPEGFWNIGFESEF